MYTTSQDITSIIKQMLLSISEPCSIYQNINLVSIVANVYDKPRYYIHYKADAPLNIRALFYIPEYKPSEYCRFGNFRVIFISRFFYFRITQFRKSGDCTIYIAKTKAMISCAVAVQPICTFVFAYAKSRFSHYMAQYTSLVWLTVISVHRKK